MKITCLGSGAAFTMKNFNQSYLIEEDGRKMLFDCGRNIPEALQNAGVKFVDIDDIYISHCHADHTGGLEFMAFSRYDWLHKPRNFKDGNYAPRLIANEQLLKDLWDYTLKGGLLSMEGFEARLSTFFVPIAIKPNVSFNWQGWKCDLVQQIHIMSGNMISWTFGLLMAKEGHDTVYFTADSQHCSPRQIEDFYRKADLIFQDCECIGTDTVTKEFKFGTGVHANYSQLAGYDNANSIKLPKETKAKMFLSHYQDFVLENKDFLGQSCDWDDLASKDGFQGFAKVGQNWLI
jgi:ribonuclease BN (tRNA processing enzyme)